MTSEEEKRVEDLVELVNKAFGNLNCYNMQFVMDGMPILTEDVVDRVFSACLHSRCYNSAALMALRYRRLETLLRGPRPRSLDHHLFFFVQTFQMGLITYLSDDRRWTCLRAMLLLCFEEGFDHEDGELGIYFLHDMHVRMFGEVMRGCSQSDVPMVKRMLDGVTKAGIARKFRFLVHSDNANVRRAVSEYFQRGGRSPHPLAALLELVCQDRVKVRNTQAVNRGRSYHDLCLNVARQAGLFELTPRWTAARDSGDDDDPGAWTPLGKAVHHNQPDLVKFVHGAGTVGHNELFLLSGDQGLEQRCKNPPPADGDAAGQPGDPAHGEDFPAEDDGRAAREIRSFLRSKAFNPRSLLGLGLRAVSPYMGWGHAREVKITALEIASTLKENLRFKTNAYDIIDTGRPVS